MFFLARGKSNSANIIKYPPPTLHYDVCILLKGVVEKPLSSDNQYSPCPLLEQKVQSLFPYVCQSFEVTSDPESTFAQTWMKVRE